jgi:two-component system invasion response regulator UvrY
MLPEQSHTIKLAIVDDHKLFRKGLVSLIEIISPLFHIAFEADDGIDMQQKISESGSAPDVIIMDVNMPRMGGQNSLRWLQANHPTVSVLIVSMIEKEETIIEMLKAGAKGYLCKDVEPQELKDAILSVFHKGFYYTDFITGKLIHSLKIDTEKTRPGKLHTKINEREREFITLACSELTYQQIADKMFLSPKTIDGYRNSLFEKLNVKSRVGLVLYAIKNDLVTLG